MTAFDQNEKLPVIQAWLIQAETIVKPLLSLFPDQGEQRQLLKAHTDIVYHAEDLAALLQPFAKKPVAVIAGKEGYLVGIPLSLANYFSCRSVKRKEAVKAGKSLSLDHYEIVTLRDFYVNIGIITLFAEKFSKKNEEIVKITKQLLVAWPNMDEILAKAEGGALIYDESRYIGIPDNGGIHV